MTDHLVLLTSPDRGPWKSLTKVLSQGSYHFDASLRTADCLKALCDVRKEM